MTNSLDILVLELKIGTNVRLIYMMKLLNAFAG